MSRQPAPTQTGTRKTNPLVRKWIPLVLAPLVAVTTAVVGWWWMPKPHIPKEFQVTNYGKPDKALVGRAAAPTVDTAAAGQQHPSDKSIPAAAPSVDSPITRQPAVPTTSGKTIVSLGDSITFGYNLPGAATGHPSHDAFPYLVGQQHHWQVIDLGVPGWTSGNLLAALHTAKFARALKRANLVTVDIGSNDLLHASYHLLANPQAPLPPGDAVMNQALYQQAITGFADNLPGIIADIRQQTHAPIVLINLYDPFPDGSSLHNVGEQLIAAANQVLWNTAAQTGIPVANAYQRFNHHQAAYVRLADLDIHPTIAGQKVLADLVDSVLGRPLWHLPVYYATAKGLGVPIETKPQAGTWAISWLPGGSGSLVTNATGNWLEVITASGQKGYVQKGSVNLLLRPWNNVSFQRFNEKLPTGQIIGNGAAGPIPTLAWQGTTYGPIAALARFADASVTQKTALREVSIVTPLHSGLTQTGLFSPQGTPQGSPIQLTIQASSHSENVSFETSGWLVTIDGEPIQLQHPVIITGGQIYVPAKAFWRALGGTVTLDKHGLQQLSAVGS